MSEIRTQGKISALGDYYSMLKVRITFLVLVTALAGSVLAFAGPIDWWPVIHMLIGTALCAGGASALNQYMERDVDGLMRRTQNRPLPMRRISPGGALVFGLIVCATGVVYLAARVNLLSAGLGLFTITTYLLVYTPSKRVTWWSTLIGAVPGAMPPVIGWAAVQGDLGTGAWLLFAIMFLWQIPHFLSIAWMYRADYERAGFPVLPVCDPTGGRTARHITSHCVALLLVSLAPTWMGLTGQVYFVGALIIGVGFLAFGIATAVYKTQLSAKRLLLASIVYHPVLLTLIVIDSTGGPF